MPCRRPCRASSRSAARARRRPAAAGIAALLLSAQPGLSVDALYAIMTDPANALDCPAPGNPDVDCGAGFLLADRALPMVLDSTPPVDHAGDLARGARRRRAAGTACPSR